LKNNKDGDMAWTCWNQELLDCLPEVIEENKNIPDPEIKMTNDKCVWTASVEERLVYDLHFTRHTQLLGKYSETLDVSIDMYGFNDSRTILLGSAAFIQVRKDFTFVYGFFCIYDSQTPSKNCRLMYHIKIHMQSLLTICCK
jgi:hypothetical protein